MERITERMLERQIDRLNTLTGNPLDQYTKHPDGKFTPNPGNYHLAIQLGSYRLEQMAEGGGVHSVLFGESKRDLFNQARAFIDGIQAKELRP